MKRKGYGVLLVVSALLIWTAAPAWSEEGQSPAAAPAETQSQAPADTQIPAAPAQAAPAPAPESQVRIADAVVCQDVVDRSPVGSGDVFPKETAKVYCFCRVVGVEGESSITQNWYYKGTLKASVKLPVRSSNWRTWSSKTMSPDWSGEWMVEILSAEGTPLGSIIFFLQ